MIKCILQADTLKIVQNAVSPTVYLDHWALRVFSQDEALRQRLTTALKSQNGTLMLSWLNLAEFRKVTDELQGRWAEDLVEGIMPHVFLLQIEPFVVIEQENQLLAGGPPVAPHANAAFLEALIALRPTSPKLLTARELFTAQIRAQNRPGIRTTDGLADVTINRLEAMRNELANNSDFQSDIRQLPSGQQLPAGTRYILRELVRSFLVDTGIRLTRNHVIDLLHAVVPVSYCDFVLLDRHWTTMVERARARLNTTALSVPIAKVFSRRDNGIDRFLCELESGHW